MSTDTPNLRTHDAVMCDIQRVTGQLHALLRLANYDTAFESGLTPDERGWAHLLMEELAEKASTLAGEPSVWACDVFFDDKNLPDALRA